MSTHSLSSSSSSLSLSLSLSTCYSEYATDVNVLVARKAIQAIGKIALRLPGRANTCTHKLISLLSMEISHVTSEALISLASELCACMYVCISRWINGYVCYVRRSSWVWHTSGGDPTSPANLVQSCDGGGWKISSHLDTWRVWRGIMIQYLSFIVITILGPLIVW